MKKPRECGSCLHLERDKIFAEPCYKEGKIATSTACNSYVPDLYSLAHDDDKFNDLELFGGLMAKMSVTQLSILSALADRERITRKYGYRFFQRVYVRYVGPASNNYLSNFMSARILDVDSRAIRIIGDSDYKAYIVLQHVKGKTGSLYDVDTFNVLRSEMIANRKLVDPSLKRQSRLAPSSAKGQVANVDELIPETVKVRIQGMRKHKSSDDLTTLVSRMNTGMYGTRESRKSQEVEISWAGG